MEKVEDKKHEQRLKIKRGICSSVVGAVPIFSFLEPTFFATAEESIFGIKMSEGGQINSHSHIESCTRPNGFHLPVYPKNWGVSQKNNFGQV